jgi:hypothetical protein
MARPRKKIDKEQLRQLAERQWNDREIAAFFNVSLHTIHRRFGDQIDKHRALGMAKRRDIAHAAIQTIAKYLDPQRMIGDALRISAAAKLIKLGQDSIKVEVPVNPDGNTEAEVRVNLIRDLKEKKKREAEEL